MTSSPATALPVAPATGGLSLRTVLTFRYEVVVGFALVEVLVFPAPGAVQAVVALVEYAFITLALLQNPRHGVLYFVSFTLLAMGSWSHVRTEDPVYTFWGLRAGGVSLNILYAAGVFAWLVSTTGFRYRPAPFGLDSRFLNGFIIYSAFVGLVAVILSANHFDNFLGDALTYAPYFVYLYLLTRIDRRDAEDLFRYGMSATVLAMLLSFATGIRFTYGSGMGHEFVLMNAFAFIAPFAVFLLRPLYGRWHYALLVAAVLGLLATGAVFTGGKILVLFVLTIAWVAYRSRAGLAIVAGAALLVVLFVEPLVELAALFDERVLLAYKISQIYDVFIVPDLRLIAATPTSMGNLIAEALTVAEYLREQPLVLLFGKGFGGGVPDLQHYLAPLAKPGFGYSVQDALRDDFVRLHLPVFEVALKTGIVGCAAYIALLVRRALSRSAFAFIYFVLLFTVFYVSKEMLLLTLLMLKLATPDSADAAATG